MICPFLLLYLFLGKIYSNSYSSVCCSQSSVTMNYFFLNKLFPVLFYCLHGLHIFLFFCFLIFFLAYLSLSKIFLHLIISYDSLLFLTLALGNTTYPLNIFLQSRILSLTVCLSLYTYI